jgi:hypothetical protein
MATMDLHLVVAGLLTRNAALSTLLMNHADRIEQGCFGHGVATAPCFIVPAWTVCQPLSAPLTREVLTVEAHTSRDDPRCPQNLDTILGLLHAVLTDSHARRSVTARHLATAADLVVSGVDTVFKVGAWEIAGAPSKDAGAAQQRLLPWPDCSAVTTTGFLAPRTISMN